VLHEALGAGQPVDVPIDSVAASALGATRVGTVPFQVLNSPRARSLLDRLWEEFRLAVGPAAAAVPFAAWLAGQVTADLPCFVLCGANTDWARTRSQWSCVSGEVVNGGTPDGFGGEGGIDPSGDA
jgi:threonine dehydratase